LERLRWLSPLTRRVLAVNLAAPLVLVVGLLYLGDYKQALYDSAAATLKVQAELIATAMAEGAVWPSADLGADQEELLGQAVADFGIAPRPAGQIIRRSQTSVAVRARVFDANGRLLIDGSNLPGREKVRVDTLPSPDAMPTVSDLFRALYDRIEKLLGVDRSLPLYVEKSDQSADDYAEVYAALNGEAATHMWRLDSGGRLLSVAVPVQYTKEVVGALMLTKTGAEIEQTLFTVRMTILKLFVLGLGVTVVLSLYLAGTLTRPLLRLAKAAERIRSGTGRHPMEPGLTLRADEIGELATAMTEMTEALWDRMDAIERFAADVAHEIKNPLTSLKSAVETIAKVQDEAKVRQLMGILQDDVERLDRLITDISNASRLDSELSRVEMTRVSWAKIIAAMAEIHAATETQVALNVQIDGEVEVQGQEGRLVQVLRNLLANAISFSPPGGAITLHACAEGSQVRLDVEDEGPGLTSGSEEDVFKRFYSDRPAGEKFGSHSGLGLSISRQIVTAFHGALTAENRVDSAGKILGARFTVKLPRA